jgi:hypothetical protein
LFRDTEEPAPHEAEDEYWKIVSDKDVHMQVVFQSSFQLQVGRGQLLLQINILAFCKGGGGGRKLCVDPRLLLKVSGSMKVRILKGAKINLKKVPEK